jgi:hypothetical protein
MYPLAETPQLPPPPAFELINKGSMGQPRQTTSLCNPLDVCADIENIPFELIDYVLINIIIER